MKKQPDIPQVCEPATFYGNLPLGEIAPYIVERAAGHLRPILEFSKQIIGIPARETGATISRIHAGLPIAAFDKLATELDVTPVTLGATLRVAPRTLARRRAEGRLDATESERLVRITHLFEFAIQVLGSADHARRWFKSPKKALAQQTPLAYAATEIGAREVEDLLGRIEHGVFG